MLPGCYPALNLSEAGFTSQEWDCYLLFPYLNSSDICLLIQILTGYLPASFLVEGAMVGTTRKAEPWGGGRCAHTRGERLHSFSELLDFYEDRVINLWISLFISTFKPIVVPWECTAVCSDEGVRISMKWRESCRVPGP